MWLGVCAWVVVGLAIQYLLRFFFVIWSFWLERGLTVSRLYYQFYALAEQAGWNVSPDHSLCNQVRTPICIYGEAFLLEALTGRAHWTDYFLVSGILIGYTGILHLVLETRAKKISKCKLVDLIVRFREWMSPPRPEF